MKSSNLSVGQSGDDGLKFKGVCSSDCSKGVEMLQEKGCIRLPDQGDENGQRLGVMGAGSSEMASSAWQAQNPPNASPSPITGLVYHRLKTTERQGWQGRA